VDLQPEEPGCSTAGSLITSTVQSAGRGSQHVHAACQANR